MKLKFNLKSLEIQFSNDANQQMKNCYQSQNSFERGGILMGELYLNKNLIIITDIIEAPSKILKQYNYEMNVDYIQQKIDTVWTKSHGSKTYLGDWHTHPEENPKPSFQDYITFSKNYFQSSFDHNFLIYIIFGLNYYINHSVWMGITNGFITKTYTSE